jgi:hypothetical protein
MTAATIAAPVLQELHADAIAWELDPRSPWLDSTPVLDVAIEVLPAIEDDTVARLLERLVLVLVGQCEELAAVRATLSAAVRELHEQHLLVRRLREQLRDLRDTRRADREAA